MSHPVFFIPGFHGSGPAHWQSWLQSRLHDSSTLHGVDWEVPDLTAWADQTHRQLAGIARPAIVVAHSFGCLVAAAVAAENPAAIAAIVFVAPADPLRFAARGGLRNTRFDRTARPVPSVATILPESLPASINSVVIASENDPWLNFSSALVLHQSWHSHFVDLGEAGHINTESGYGPWPGLLRKLQLWRQQDKPDFRSLHRNALERAVSAQADTELAALYARAPVHEGLKFSL